MRFLLLVGALSYGTQAFGTPSAATKSAQVQASLVDKASAPQRVAPSGQARITVLARGHNSFIGELWLAPNAKVPLHQDASEEYLHILSGHGQITIDGKTSAVAPGMTIFMPAKSKVEFKNGSKPLICLQIFSGPESANKYGNWTVFKR